MEPLVGTDTPTLPSPWSVPYGGVALVKAALSGGTNDVR